MELDNLDLVSAMDMEISKNSFPYFFQNVLGMMYPSYMQEWLELMQSTDRTVIICSRDHGKSVFMHSWVVWNLVFQEPPYQMLYISSNQKQTLVHMREIDRIFNHPALKKFKPSRGWAIGNIQLTNGNAILERSVGSQIRGLHPQEIIIDDPLKEFSMVAIQRVTDWFFGDMIPTLHHTSNLRMIGTPFTYTDIFTQLEENEAYTVRKYPCLNSLNEPLWKERWNYDALMQRKAEIGSLKFTREYLCVPISTGTSLFNPEFVDKCKARDYVLKLGHRKDKGYKYYVGVDPAISTDGDYNVITVIEMDDEKNKTIVHIDRAKNVDFRQNIEKIRLIGAIFEPEVILFETNTFAKSFTQELRNISDLNVQDFNTTRKKKQEIILSLQMNIENGKIKFPYGDNNSRQVTNLLIEELSMFSITQAGRFEGVGAHDDLVMSLALATAATHNSTEVFMLLDDMGIFDEPKQQLARPASGLVGLNFLEVKKMAEKLSEMFTELSESAEEDEALEAQEQSKINDMKNASMDDWFYSQPILSHFDIEKKYAKEFNTNLSQARRELSIIVKKYEVEGNDVPTVVKQLKKYRRTLKGETKIEITNSIDNLIKAYSEHLSDSIDNIYWIKKYKSVLNNMVCSEDNIIKLSYVSEESTRREIIDVLCKYWENKLHMRDMPYSSDYAKLNKSMSVSKREFKSILRKYMNTTSTKDIIKHEILKAVCEDNGISSRQIHERLPKKLFNKTSPAIISKMAKSMDITSVDGAFYKLNDDIKKDIYAYTAAFIDSDGYITMDKNFNPRVGLIATGERGKAFMMEMHKSLGCGRLHLDQKSPQATRSVQRLNFYSGDDVVKLLTKCRPHFKMKGANADILLELVRMKKSHKKADWYKSRREELFQLMKYENHKDHVGYDFSQYGIDPTTVVKFHDNSKMFEMDRLEGIVV